MCCEGLGRASSVQACGKGLFSLGVWVARTCSGVFQVYWFKFLLLFFSLFFIALCLFWFLFLLFFLLLFRAKCTGSTFRGSIRCRRLWCAVLWASGRRVRAFRRQCGKFFARHNDVHNDGSLALFLSLHVLLLSRALSTRFVWWLVKSCFLLSTYHPMPRI